MNEDPTDPKEIERQLFRGAPESAKRLHKASKKLIRESKRKEWWKYHGIKEKKNEA